MLRVECVEEGNIIKNNESVIQTHSTGHKTTALHVHTSSENNILIKLFKALRLGIKDEIKT